ncbi:MAG: hypothetical protein GX847_12960 [Clostridiales bacterium]|nr:hypothetical protein [Clostridiales bacterium]
MLLNEYEMMNACDWLLHNAGPAIRYRTLTDILHRAADDEAVQKAYAEIVSGKRLREIMAQQNADGSFGDKPSFHGTDTTEDYLRELFELGISPDHPVLKKGLDFTERLYGAGTDIAGWIVGLLTEPLGRAGENQQVINWFTEYSKKFDEFYTRHRQDWLIDKRGYLATYYLEIPYYYVIRTISYSWRWLRGDLKPDISRILEFLLTDMADVSKLYWIAPNNPKVSYPNFFHIVSSDALYKKQPGALDLAIALEGLWLLAEFGIIEVYPNVLNCFKYVSQKKNNDGLWEFPIQGMTRAKAKWYSYHGFALEEDWRKKESPLAELAFRICLTAEKNRTGTM